MTKTTTPFALVLAALAFVTLWTPTLAASEAHATSLVAPALA